MVNKIKKICENLPELNIPNDDDFFILETNVSLLHWGAILKRKENYKEFLCNPLYKCPEELVSYTSGTLKDVETRYDINRKECLAVNKSVAKFEPYWLPKKFLIRTDNTLVKPLLTNKFGTSAAERPLIKMQMWFAPFKFDIVHIKGKYNFILDFLTRNEANQEGIRSIEVRNEHENCCCGVQDNTNRNGCCQANI